MTKRVWLVAGLVLAELALCAGIISIFWTSIGWLNRSGARVRAFEFDTTSVQTVEEERLPVSGPATLSVDNTVGDISVQTGTVDEVVLTLTKTAWGPTQAEAEARLADLQVTVTQNGNAIRVVVVKPDELNFLGSDRSDRVDFAVVVPAETAVTAQTGFGDLMTTGTTGDLDLHTSAGKVTANSITGSLDLHSDFGDIRVEEAASETVLVKTSSGEVRLERVQASGALEAESDFGDITVLASSADTLTVHTSSGSVTLTDLDVAGLVAVDSDFGRLKLEQVLAGAYDLETSSGDVTVAGGTGALKAHTDFGDVEVSGVAEASLDLHSSSGSVVFEGALGQGPHSLTTDFGTVRLTLPADTAVTFDLSTDFGGIQSEFPITLSGGNELDQDHWQGTLNGGGESLTVHTSSGDIRLLQAQS